MQALTPAQQAQQQNVAQQIKDLLQNVSVTFAGIKFNTQVKTAAAHKALNIVKHTSANVQMFSNINEFTSVYANAVKKSADVVDFKAQENYFEHTDCYSVVKHKTAENLYLYAIFNNARSTYSINGAPATKDEVAEYLTPSERAKLYDKGPVRNVTYNIEHDVHVRTVALHNVTEINAMKQSVKF